MNRFGGEGGRREMLAASRSWLAGMALALVCLTVYLPGLFTIPPIDRDESRFAQASRQMFEAAAFKGTPQWREDFHSGGWVVPHVQDRPRLNKPPLVYWLQVASAWVLTRGDPVKDVIWMYRVPGVLCAIASVLLTWRLGLRMFDPRAAWLAAVFLAVCPVVVFDAHQARADQLLLTLTIATMWALWNASPLRKQRDDGSGDMEIGAAGPAVRSHVQSKGWIAFWTLLAFSILAKGPITPMIVVLACVAISLATRSWRWLWKLRPILGLLIIAMIVGPWVYAVGEHVGWEKYLAIIKDETIGRSVEAKEGHWGPPGYHTVLLAVLFWPGSLTTALAVVNAWRKARGSGGGEGWRSVWIGRRAELFLLAWIIPAWIVFEILGTKLPHYTLPMYPAIALLSARALLGLRVRVINVIDRLGQWVWWGIGLGITLAAQFALISLQGGHLPVRPSMLTTGLLTISLWFVLFVLFECVRRRRLQIGSIAGAGTCLLATWAIFCLFAPLQWDDLWLSDRIAKRLTVIDSDRTRPVAAVGYQEDSLVFLTRGRIERIDEPTLTPWMAAHPDGLIVIDAAISKTLGLRVPEGLPASPEHGFNYARGRQESVVVAERAK